MAIKYYGKAIFNNNEWVVTDCNPQVAIRLKALFPRMQLGARPPFKFPDNLENCYDLEWFFQRYPVEMDTACFNRLKIKKKLFEKRSEQLEEILSNEYVPSLIALKDGKNLREYQARAVELILKNKFLLLGDDLGLGKTVSGIGVLVSQGTLPAFIVVPTHLMYHWEEKIKEFTNLSVHLIQGTQPYKLPNADVFIMKYSCLSGWEDYFHTFTYKTVLFDEVHYLRRSESSRYQAAQELAKHAEFRVGFSATPIFNYGEEIFNILDILNPNGLGYKSEFLREWTSNNKIIRDPKALGQHLRDSYMFLRRTPEEVGRELPPINRIIQNVDFDHKTARDAETLMKELALKVVTGSYVERGMAARDLDRFARQITGLAKAKAVVEYVKILLENDRPVLLVGWHRAVYDIWAEEFKKYDPVFYTGDENTDQKDENARKFKEKKSKLMIISLASGEGLDGLQFVSTDIVFGELGWNPATHDQLIGRLNRDGQVHQVTAHFLVSDIGSDPVIIELLGLKASQSRRIVDPNAEIEKIVEDHSRMKVLAEHILKKYTNP